MYTRLLVTGAMAALLAGCAGGWLPTGVAAGLPGATGSTTIARTMRSYGHLAFIAAITLAALAPRLTSLIAFFSARSSA